MNKICHHCKYASADIYGDYCSLARYKSSEYGKFFLGNDCVFDDNNSERKSLFEPNESISTEALDNRRNQLSENKEILDLKSKIFSLQRTVHELTK